MPSTMSYCIMGLVGEMIETITVGADTFAVFLCEKSASLSLELWYNG